MFYIKSLYFYTSVVSSNLLTPEPISIKFTPNMYFWSTYNMRNKLFGKMLKNNPTLLKTRIKKSFLSSLQTTDDLNKFDNICVETTSHGFFKIKKMIKTVNLGHQHLSMYV